MEVFIKGCSIRGVHIILKDYGIDTAHLAKWEMGSVNDFSIGW